MEGFFSATLPWREAGPPNHHDDTVDSVQYVVNKDLSLGAGGGGLLGDVAQGLPPRPPPGTFFFFFITLKPRVE